MTNTMTSSMKRVSFKDDLTSVGTSPPPSLHESEYASMWYTGQQLRNFRAEAKEIRRNPKAFDPTQDCWRGLEVYVSRRKEVQTSRRVYSRSMLASLQQHQQQHQRQIQEQQRKQQNQQFRTSPQEPQQQQPQPQQKETEQPYNCFQRFVEPNALRQLAVQQSRDSAEQAIQDATRDYLEALKLYQDEASDEADELSLAGLHLNNGPIKKESATITSRWRHNRGRHHRWRTGLRTVAPSRHTPMSSAAALSA